jgi:hypothetical protein
MAPGWSPRKRQVVLAFVYALIFPVTNLLGGTLEIIGLILTVPFMPIAWIGGLAMVDITGFEASYAVGMAITIFLQVWLVMAWRASALKRRTIADRDPL